ncbi:MAG: RNA polymerase sigma factor [Clostridia bacterium]
MNDLDIIELYFKRDENAIEETKKSYDKKLVKLANNILRNTSDSEESVSDTYLSAWNSIPPQKPKYLFAYLSKICRCVCFDMLDYKNAQKRSAEIVALSDELLMCIPSRDENNSEGKELTKALERFLLSLEKESRVIFMRRYWFCESVRDIAKKFNFTESKVKTSLFRTRGKLKRFLESEGIYI